MDRIETAPSLHPLMCNRLRGGSVMDCACRLPPWDRETGGGFLPCPPDALGILIDPAPRPVVPQPAERALAMHEVERGGARMFAALTGDICATCGSPDMVRTGTCMTCRNCGDTSGGCS